MLLLAGLVYITAPEPRLNYQPGTSTRPVQTGEIYAIVEQRCTGCHAGVPTFEGFTSAPLGIELDSPQKLKQHAEKVYQSVVITHLMPLANLTHMTDNERYLIASWFEKSAAMENEDPSGERTE